MTLLPRRALLCAPFLASLPLAGRAARAQGAPPIRRLVVMFTPNGTVPDAWRPTGGERDFALGPILAPLERHRARLIIVDGVEHHTAADGPGDGHQKGIGQMLTAVPLGAGAFTAGNAAPAGWAGGPSVDQVVADAVSAGRRFRSLEFGVQCGAADNWGRMCFRAAGRPLAPMDDPVAAWARLFAPSADPDAAQAILARRRSALDLARSTLASLRAELSPADRARLDASADAVREAERALPVPGLDEARRCGVTAAPPRADDDPERLPALGQAQVGLLTAALACDLTRVATLQWTRAASPATFPWLGVFERHHDLSHLSPDVSDVRDKLVRVQRWYAEQFAHLLDALAAAGDGGLLDDTLVAWCNELATGHDHGARGVPWVFAAGRNVPVRAGRFVRAQGTSHGDLLAAVCQAMGLSTVTSFGDPRYARGAYGGLR